MSPVPSAVLLCVLATPPGDALGTLAAQVLETSPSPRPPVALFVQAPSEPLASAFSTVLAAGLAQRRLSPVVVQAESFSAAETAARASGARSLLRLQLSSSGGHLRADGDWLGTWVNFWGGRLATRPAQPAAAVTAAVEADAQALALAQAAPRQEDLARQRWRSAPLHALALPTAALAAGDLDGDGKDEVAAMTDEEVVLLSGDGEVLARHPLSSLPRSPTPCREPFGALAFQDSPRRLHAHSASRARGEALSWRRGGELTRSAFTLSPVLAASDSWRVEGQLVPGENAFAPALRPSGRAAVEAGGKVTTVAVATSGELLWVFPDGTARWLGQDGSTTALTGLGAASALVDLDGDGQAELLTTSPSFQPSPEEVRLMAKGQERPLWREPLPRGRALQLVPADLDGDGRVELVLGVWLDDGTAELWVMRRRTGP